MTMDDIQQRWPVAMRVLMDHGMLCVGCPIGSFHTIPEACEAHGVEETDFVAALAREIDAG